MKGSALTDVGNATDPQDTVRITRWDAAIVALRPFLFMSPYLLVFFLFLFLPALSGFVISFTDWEILGTPNWVGLENFNYISGDRMFWRAVYNTLVFTLLTVIPMVVGGLLFAVLFNEKLRGRVVARTVIFLPYAVMVTIVGILWRWIYDKNFGLANYYLGEINIEPVSWLTSPHVALIAVAITTVWWQIGTNTIIYLAGLQEIPEDLYEASKVDGATALQRFLFITVPSLRLIHIFVIPLSVISSMRVFGQVLVMTQGGPIGSTYTLVQHLYSVGWINFRQGEAAAIGLILFLITFLLTVMQLYAFGALDFAVKQNRQQTKSRLDFRRLFKPISTVYQRLVSVFLNSLFHITDLLGRISIVPQSIKTGGRLNQKALVGYPLLIVITLLWLVPLLWMFSTSVKPERQVRQIPIEWISPDTTFDNYTRVWEAYPLLEWGLNSFNVALLTTIVALVLYVLAAYPLAFYRFRGRGFFFLGILATMLIPVEATMIPLFIVLAKLGVVDTYMSLIMPVAANAFGLYLLVQFFQSVPFEMLDSARIDGANELQILLRIIVPLSGPALTTVAILTFMTSWNNFVWPFIVSNSDATRTLPVGLATVMGSITGSPTSVQYGMVMAGSVLATLPPMLIFIFLQQYFVRGISMSGLKG